MNNMEFGGWKLKITKGRYGSQIECRKTIGGFCDYDDRRITVAGQVLLIVSLAGYKWKKESGEYDVRLSMNSPCLMTFDDLGGFGRVAEYAYKILVNFGLKIVSNGTLINMIGKYYPSLSNNEWPIIVGMNGISNGITQFIIYPRIDSAVQEMKELFDKIDNVEVKTELI